MKIRYEKKERIPISKPVEDIGIGEVFSGAIPGYHEYSDGVFMKAWDRLVCLSDPAGATWYLPKNNPYGYGVDHIDNYKELDVELLVKGEK